VKLQERLSPGRTSVTDSTAREAAAPYDGRWPRSPPARLARALRARSIARGANPNRGLLAAPALATPALVLYVGLVLIPLILAIRYSLTDKSLLFPDTHWVGTENYRDLAHDDAFKHAVRVTGLLTLLIAVAPNALGLLVAMLLRREGRIYAVCRTLFFVPQVLSAVVVSFIWQAMLTSDGILNSALKSVGLSALEQSWLDDPSHAVLSIALVVTWQFTGFCAVVYLAALKAIPDELLEAAEVDGCTGLRRFRQITWPLVAPAVTICTVLLLIVAFKLFDYVKVMTNGGPGDATDTVALEIYNVGFTENDFGYASAMAVVLFVIVAVASTVSVFLLRRREVTY
jgi:multiple sugar transport system permease protein